MESDRKKKKKKSYSPISSGIIFDHRRKGYSAIVVNEDQFGKDQNAKKRNESFSEPMRYSRREKKVKRDKEYIYLEEIDLINKVECEVKITEGTSEELKQVSQGTDDNDKLIQKEIRRGRKKKEDSSKIKKYAVENSQNKSDPNQPKFVFTRVDKHGTTSLPFLVPKTEAPVVQTLGQKIDPTGGPIPFPKPVKVKMPPKNPVPPPPPDCDLVFEDEEEDCLSATFDEDFTPVRVEGDPIFDVISASTYLMNEAKEPTPVLPISFRELRSLSSLGIDTEFLDSLEKQYALQCKLNETGNLLAELSEIQKSRLSKGRKDASAQEIRLAGKVGRELTGLMKMAPPGSLISSDTVHKSLGIVIDG